MTARCHTQNYTTLTDATSERGTPELVPYRRLNERALDTLNSGGRDDKHVRTTAGDGQDRVRAIYCIAERIARAEKAERLLGQHAGPDREPKSIARKGACSERLATRVRRGLRRI